MASSTATVAGLKELGDTLRSLGAIVQKNGGPLKVAMRKGANKFRDRARQLAPVETGRLSKSVASRRVRNPEREGFTEAYDIVPKSGNSRADLRGAFYWRFIELGTSKQPKQSFLRPAFEQEKADVAQEFTTDLRKAIALVVKKSLRAPK